MEVLVEEELILSPPSQQEREQQTKGMPVVQETQAEIMEEVAVVAVPLLTPPVQAVQVSSSFVILHHNKHLLPQQVTLR